MLFAERMTPGREGPLLFRVVVWHGTTPKVASAGHSDYPAAVKAARDAGLHEFAVERYRERTSDAELADRGLERV